MPGTTASNCSSPGPFWPVTALERKVPVQAYFNNTQAGAAVRDAFRLAEMLKAWINSPT